MKTNSLLVVLAVLIMGAACSGGDSYTAVCGNALLDPGEVCDDGNAVSGDGCNATCTSEEYCGNGILDPGEQCEDGNTTSGDGCSAACAIEMLPSCGNGTVDAGEQCDDGNYFPGDGCSPYCTTEICGNGILDPGEECEDGNTTTGDGCSADCRAEVAGACGDGVVDIGEACDDGNVVGGDGCGPFCTVELCGNGILDQGEVCEDGNNVSGDGCSANCLSAEVCGNGILDAAESCDDGNVLAGDGCDSACRLESSTCGNGNLESWEGCDDGNTVPGDGCSATCVLESCGNGVVDAGEGCDDGNGNDTDNCPSTCRPAACGDGFVHALYEQCDDANLQSGDGCSSTCRLEYCGNGVLDPGEACDDSNMVDTDSCPTSCQPASCGDGFVHTGFESCDDGNNVSGDGCSSSCLSTEICGNGYVDPGEVCDDGNLDDNDACPTTCQPAACGDGFVHLGFEGCDDGNLIDNDGCSSLCVPDGCGSGTVDGNEECDQGGANGTAGASCFTNCVTIDVAFAPSSTIAIDQGTAGNGPKAIAAADMNGDGVLDLATTNSTSGYTTVLHGFGDGRFWAPWFLNVDTNPFAVRLGDVNGDGIKDAVTANRTGDSISVALGDGQRFGAAQSFSMVVGLGGDEPRDVALADMDGDGDLDAVTANTNSDNVTLLLNNGAGEFTPTLLLSTAIGLGGDRPESVEIGDVTGDGILDIVTANVISDDITVIPGLGGGSFAAAQVFTNRAGARGDYPSDLALADVTGDGLADVITANLTSDDICALVANGAGGLNGPVCFSSLGGASGDGPMRLAVADMNNDFEPDIVVTSTNSDEVTMFRGVAGGATFAAPVSFTTRVGSAGARPQGIQIADLNGDGSLDVVTSNITTHDISVLLGTGNGNLAAPLVFEAQYGYNGTDPQSFVLHDVTGDGEIDAVVASEDDADLIILAGFGDGRFTASQTTFVGNDPRAVSLADVNNDGRVDVLATDYSGDHLERLVQNDSGDFSRTSYLAYICCYSGRDLTSLATGDLDNDGDIDAVVLSGTDVDLTRFGNDGSGAFSSRLWVEVESGTEHIALADVTGDSFLDAITVSSSADRVYIRPGTGTGSFGGAGSLLTSVSTQGQSPVWATVAELSGDLVPDIVTANYASSDLSLFVGIGPGAYSAPIIIPAAFGAANVGVRNVQSGDFNGDGIPDLATVNENSDTVSVILGFGGGAFSAPQTFAVGNQPWALIVEDLNGDGLDDIATTNYGDNTISVLLGLGHP